MRQYSTNDYVKPEEVKKIIAAVPEVSRHPERDSLLIEIGWETGARISEVLKLVPEDVLEKSLVLDNLKQHKKNGKTPTKIVEVSAELCQWIKQYCEKENIGRGEWVFPAPHDKSKHLGRYRVQEMITKASEVAHVYRIGKAHPRTGGRYKGISYHVLRHSNATYLRREGTRIEVIGKQLGHSSPESTNKYASVVYDDVRAAIAKFNINLYHPLSASRFLTDIKPICCGKSMRINAHINRLSGKRIQYICSVCGHTQTEKEKGGK